MRYSNPKKDLRSWLPLISRKATITVLLAMILIFLTFTEVSVTPLKTQQYQVAIQVEDVPITRQEFKRITPINPIGPIKIVDDPSEADSVTNFSSELIPKNPPPPINPQEEKIPFYKVEIKPSIISQPKPKYPDIARKSGLEGSVIIEFVVDTAGNVLQGSAKVTEAIPKGIFEEAALDAIYNSKFSPGQQRDRKVCVTMHQAIAFKLK